MDILIQKEELKRILLSGATEVTAESVADFSIQCILAPLAQMGVVDFSIVLFTHGKSPVFFATSPDYAPKPDDIVPFVASMSRFGCYRFNVAKEAECYVGYTGNDLDLVAVKVANKHGVLLEEIIDGFWYHFFEFS